MLVQVVGRKLSITILRITSNSSEVKRLFDGRVQQRNESVHRRFITVSNFCDELRGVSKSFSRVLV